MPKDRRVSPLSSHRDKASPYPCISKDSNRSKLENSLAPVVAEWKEARCPICMEYPHNAVLLICSSITKGCRPYICDTSSRHSNCLDQFLNVPGGELLKEKIYFAQMQSSWIPVILNIFSRRSIEGRIPQITCPFCRGLIIACAVMHDVRFYMNKKVRICSLEDCNFSGNYVELRKHARREHPNVKPLDTDPERQADWQRLMHEMDVRDTLNLVESESEHEEYIYSNTPDYDGDTPARTVDNNRSTVASQAHSEGIIHSSTASSRSHSEAVRERTDDRLLDRRSVGSENTLNERSDERSLDRRSTSPRMARESGSSSRISGRSSYWRSNSQPEVSSGRRVRNTGSRSTGGRSTVERSVERRSRTMSHGRWRNPHYHH